MLQSVVDIIKERNVRVAVNLSFDDMINKNTSKFIFETLEKNKDIALLIDFEILESEEIANYDQIKKDISFHGLIMTKKNMKIWDLKQKYQNIFII